MRKSRQQIQKLFHGECLVCGENRYEVLDAHRIIEGGKYIPSNIVVLCSIHHRLVHSGCIKFDRKYDSTNGIILHWFMNGQEFWTKVKN